MDVAKTIFAEHEVADHKSNTVVDESGCYAVLRASVNNNFGDVIVVEKPERFAIHGRHELPTWWMKNERHIWKGAPVKLVGETIRLISKSAMTRKKVFRYPPGSYRPRPRNPRFASGIQSVNR